MTSTQPALEFPLPGGTRVDTALLQTRAYPHLRYMGSKYRLLPTLANVFAQLGGETALDPFTGSGVVSYLLKAQGFHVTSRDYLNFPVVLARASLVNQTTMLTSEDVEQISRGQNRDGRDFISTTYGGLYFTPEDLAFLDSAWSQIATMRGARRDLAIASLVLAAARKQPRGVFTVTGLRYDDGRESLHLPLADQFRRCAEAWNSSVFEGPACQTERGDVSSAEGSWDLVYLDPPYAPPRDDNDYIKRYWFLEGLSDYWQDGTAEIMEKTGTKKLVKRPTAFGSKRTIGGALAATLEQFSGSSIVLSYGSNAVPDLDTLTGLIADVKGSRPEVITLRHRYHFGTHASANRREAEEYILIAP
ncbi:DNA adenine methylase [Micrococcus porci]|uniref:DNA adenine methylase n=1 Tax=Micrococcus porci TaxID=2856555 RepID=UPI003CF2C25B